MSMDTLSLAARRAAACLLCLTLACSPKPPSSEQPPVSASDSASLPPAAAGISLDGREWSLVALGDASAPVGAGGRPATIRFDLDNGRAAGFAGCNRYSASFTLEGDRLTFGPAISTKMACEDGDALERGFLAVLPEVNSYERSDSMLSLVGAAGSLARFRGE